MSLPLKLVGANIEENDRRAATRHWSLKKYFPPGTNDGRPTGSTPLSSSQILFQLRKPRARASRTRPASRICNDIGPMLSRTGLTPRRGRHLLWEPITPGIRCVLDAEITHNYELFYLKTAISNFRINKERLKIIFN